MPVLPDRVTVGEGLARADARKADPGDAIHASRQQDAVSVYRGVLLQMVGYPKDYLPPFTQADQRNRDRTVEGDGTGLAPVYYDGHSTDLQIGDGRAVRSR